MRYRYGWFEFINEVFDFIDWLLFGWWMDKRR